jgi:hypothetical protein
MWAGRIGVFLRVLPAIAVRSDHRRRDETNESITNHGQEKLNIPFPLSVLRASVVNLGVPDIRIIGSRLEQECL